MNSEIKKLYFPFRRFLSKSKMLVSKKIIFSLLIVTTAYACNSMANGKTESFKVWGNCGMCKKTIEKALSEKGITGDWNKKTKIIKVTYDSLKFKSQQVHEIICASGYDTEKCNGDDKAYDKLHECCKYERKKK